MRISNERDGLKRTYLKLFHIKYNFKTIIFLRRNIEGDFNTKLYILLLY